MSAGVGFLVRLATYDLHSAHVRFWSLRTLGKGGTGERLYSRGGSGVLSGPESSQVGLRSPVTLLRQTERASQQLPAWGAFWPNRNGSSSGVFRGAGVALGPQARHRTATEGPT